MKRFAVLSLLLASAALAAPPAPADKPAAPGKAKDNAKAKAQAKADKKDKPMAPGGKWHAGDMDRPRPRVITPPGLSTQEKAGAPPSDAVVLFDGKNFDQWKRDPRKEDAPGTPDKVQWKIVDGVGEIVPLSGSIRTRESYKGDIQLHFEWRAPAEVVGNSQGRGNSGIFIGGFPEVQVLDSYQNDTYPDGQAAGLYGNYPPMVNASRKPGEWQVYDIIAERQRKDAKGNVIKKARLSVVHNGIVVQWGREFDSDAQTGDIGLQDHHNPVRYRNIWLRPINLTDPDAEGTPPPSKAKPAPKPASVSIKTLTAQMKYDLAEFNVQPGASVKLEFENGDDLPHNLVICKPGTDTVAMAMKQMEKAEEAVKRNWLPDDPRILQHTKLLNPHEKETLSFTAPDKADDYPFVCTFPGHAMTMRGTMHVVEPGEGLHDLKFQLYLGAWKNLPDFSKLKPHREGSVADNLIQIKLDDYKNDFGVVFTGKLKAPRTGSYRFYVACDDGARVLVDGKKVVEYDGIHPATEIKEGSIQLTEGEHEYRLEYFQAAGQIELYAAWKGARFSITPLSKWIHPNAEQGAKKARKDETTGMPLAVTNEAVIYRNFIASGGTRGIAVGYPGGFNVVWSAETMNLALLWRGAFMDAARHWNGRGGGAQAPLGYDVLRPAGEVTTPFFITSHAEDPWPEFDHKLDRAAGYQFKGYTLDHSTRAPTFSYTWNGLSVTDRFVPEGNGTTSAGKLHRIINITGQPPARSWLRLAQAAKFVAKGSSFVVDAGRVNVGGRDYPNQFVVTADDAKIAGSNLVVPARAGEIHITYAWPN